MADLHSPKFQNKNYPWLKADDVTRMIEDDELSLISNSSTSTDFGSTTTNMDSSSSESNSRSVASEKRNGRYTPVRGSLTKKATPVKNSSNDNRKTSNDVMTPSKTVIGTPRSSQTTSPLKRKINDLQMSNRTPTRSQRLAGYADGPAPKTPTGSRLSNLDDDEIVDRVKRCRTEPRRRSLAVCIENKIEAPKSERKVRRVQSVRLKRIGEEYQAFRDPTPNSEGKKVRSRLSDKFTDIKEVDGVRRSGRQVFSDVSNSKSPLAGKSPKDRSAKLK